MAQSVSWLVVKGLLRQVGRAASGLWHGWCHYTHSGIFTFHPLDKAVQPC